jgi:hypothetical protein
LQKSEIIQLLVFYRYKIFMCFYGGTIKVDFCQ